VTDALGKKIRFNTPRGESFGLLAATPGIHAAAADHLRPRAVEALGKPIR
jgi:myo-inositol-1(or 4)-monophosphatase